MDGQNGDYMPPPPLGSLTTQLTQNIFVQAYVANIYERDLTRYTHIGIVKPWPDFKDIVFNIALIFEWIMY